MSTLSIDLIVNDAITHHLSSSAFLNLVKIQEVKSGELIVVGVPDVAEKEVMKDVINTYGKTIHTWQIDRDDLPLGVPKLMMVNYTPFSLFKGDPSLLYSLFRLLLEMVKLIKIY